MKDRDGVLITSTYTGRPVYAVDLITGKEILIKDMAIDTIKMQPFFGGK